MWHAWERREKCIGFWWETQKDRDHLEYRGVDGMMGSGNDLRMIGLGSVEWIQLAQFKGRWRALVNTVMS
jgi:hypothetical protein